jgi:hemoglobin
MGGEPELRAAVDDFIDRVFADIMIGFLFAHADKARIKEKEYELAAKALGADVAYTGRALPEAHQKHPILGGHFERRMQLLRETLRDHGVLEEAARHLLAHNESMRAAITKNAGSDCEPRTEEPRRLPLAFAAMAEPKVPSTPAPKRRELPLAGPSGPRRPR